MNLVRGVRLLYPANGKIYFVKMVLKDGKNFRIETWEGDPNFRKGTILSREKIEKEFIYLG